MSRKISCNKVSLENLTRGILDVDCAEDGEERAAAELTINEPELIVHKNAISFLLDHVKMIEAPTEEEDALFKRLGLKGITFVTDKENNKFVIEYNFNKFNNVWEEFLDMDKLGI